MSQALEYRKRMVARLLEDERVKHATIVEGLVILTFNDGSQVGFSEPREILCGARIEGCRMSCYKPSGHAPPHNDATHTWEE